MVWFTILAFFFTIDSFANETCSDTVWEWCTEVSSVDDMDIYVEVTWIDCLTNTPCPNITIKCEDMVSSSRIYNHSLNFNKEATTSCMTCASCKFTGINQTYTPS